MTSNYSSLVRRSLLLAFIAVLTSVAPAMSDTYVTWTLNDVTFYSGYATGDFTIDTSTLAVTAVNVTAVADVGEGGPAPYLGAGVYYALSLGLGFTASALGVATPLAVSNVIFEDHGGTLMMGYVGTADYGYTGELVPSVAAVPLPPAACLLGTGLIPLAWFHRRKRLEK